MKALSAILLLAVASAAFNTSFFRYIRPVLGTSQTSSQTCVVLGAGIFAQAAPGLADLRLFRGTTETPYLIRTAVPTQAAEATLTPLNLGVRNGQTSLDLQIPGGEYNDLELNVSAQNFIATVTVSGSQTQGASAETRLGTFTIFDLSAQRLGRSTVLHLPPADLRYLHLRIAGPIKPEQIGGASLWRTSPAQTAFLEVATTSVVKQAGHASVVEFQVPAHVPVDRITFVPGEAPAAFTRDVHITVTPTTLPRTTTESDEALQPISFSGNLLRLHRVEDGQKIDEEDLTIPLEAQTDAVGTKWSVSVENGDDAPLALQSVRLEMQQRTLCFEAAGQASYSVFYGDPGLGSSHYDYAALFTPQPHAVQATMGPEQLNPNFQPRADDRPFTERHPALLWAALLLAIAVLGGVALRSVSNTPKETT